MPPTHQPPPPHHANYAFHQDDIPAWMTEDDADLAAPFGRAGNRQRWPSSGSGRSAGSNSSAGSSGGGGAPAETATRPTTTSSDLVFKYSESCYRAWENFLYRSVYLRHFKPKDYLSS
jgi:hypothetical protein